MSGSTTPLLRRTHLLTIVVASALLVAWLWLRREPAWHVSLTVDHRTDQGALTPWQSVKVSASIDPAEATVSHWWRPSGWTWQWSADSSALSAAGPELEWRSGKVGDHEVLVTVESPWGTKQTERVRIRVAYKPYVAIDAARLEQPNLAILPKDPAPDQVPFGISDVWVEKTEICQGESSHIRMTPFDKRVQEKWLVPVIAGEQSWDVTFVAPLTSPGPHMIPITLFDQAGSPAKDGRVDAVNTFVYIEIKACVAPFPIVVEHQPIPPDDDHVAFRAQLFDGAAWQQSVASASGSPIVSARAGSFVWTFGDGETATTTTPFTRHQYPREADRGDERATSYPVRVQAFDDARKAMAVGFATVAIPNRLRQLKKEVGLLQLVTQQTPGSHEQPDGSRSAKLALLNIDSTETARLSQMKIRLVSCEGRDMGERSADLASVFAGTVIAPRAKLSGTFTLPASGLEGICYANAEVSGKSDPGGLEVRGFFHLVTGKERGLDANAEQSKVMDRVMDLLGHPSVVTMEDLRRLEDEGKIPRGVLTKDPLQEEHHDSSAKPLVP